MVLGKMELGKLSWHRAKILNAIIPNLFPLIFSFNNPITN